MSELDGFPKPLISLVNRWDRIVCDPAKLTRIGIRPKPSNLRGLQALLCHQTPEQLMELVNLCARRWASSESQNVRDFWAHRQQAVEATIANREALQHRSKQALEEKEKNHRKKRKARAYRRQMAAQWEEKYAAEKRRILDPRLGLGLSTNTVYYGGDRTVQGGAPGSGKRR
jgi:hypothetical protein